MKLNVSLDTSVLRRHRSLKSNEILLLAELSRIGEINFYLSKMVLSEIISQEKDEIQTEFNKIFGSLKNLKRKNILDENTYNIEFDKFKKKLEDSLELINLKWKDFRIQYNIKLVGFHSVNLGNVVEDYIEGLPPFRGKKSRNDIPDAIIINSLKNLNIGTFHLVCDDNGIMSCAENDDFFHFFRSLEELFEIPHLVKSITYLQQLGEFENAFKIIKGYDDFLKTWVKKQFLSSLPLEVINRNGEKKKINDSISEVLHFNYVEIDYDKARLHQENYLFFPVMVDLRCKVLAAMTKDEANKEMEIPAYELMKDLISFVEYDDHFKRVGIYSGTLKTTIKIDVSKPFSWSEEKISLLEVYKNLLIEDSFPEFFSRFLGKDYKG
ncbi:MAG: PIN domain-containing protein [Saprospiraceae bacterium]